MKIFPIEGDIGQCRLQLEGPLPFLNFLLHIFKKINIFVTMYGGIPRWGKRKSPYLQGPLIFGIYCSIS